MLCTCLAISLEGYSDVWQRAWSPKARIFEKPLTRKPTPALGPTSTFPFSVGLSRRVAPRSACIARSTARVWAQAGPPRGIFARASGSLCPVSITLLITFLSLSCLLKPCRSPLLFLTSNILFPTSGNSCLMIRHARHVPSLAMSWLHEKIKSKASPTQAKVRGIHQPFSCR